MKINKLFKGLAGIFNRKQAKELDAEVEKIMEAMPEEDGKEEKKRHQEESFNWYNKHVQNAPKKMQAIAQHFNPQASSATVAMGNIPKHAKLPPRKLWASYGITPTGKLAGMTYNKKEHGLIGSDAEKQKEALNKRNEQKPILEVNESPEGVKTVTHLDKQQIKHEIHQLELQRAAEFQKPIHRSGIYKGICRDKEKIKQLTEKIAGRKQYLTDFSLV